MKSAYAELDFDLDGSAFSAKNKIYNFLHLSCVYLETNQVSPMNISQVECNDRNMIDSGNAFQYIRSNHAIDFNSTLLLIGLLLLFHWKLNIFEMSK